MSDDAGFPALGQLYDIGSHKMHLYSLGEGSPVVVLDAGSGDSLLTWNSVQAEIAKFTRVVAYDRSGMGWSERGPNAITLENIAEELHKLLLAAGISEPVILVGHSLGGVYMRAFAHRYPEQVAGLVLVDSSHESQASRLFEAAPHYREISNEYVAMLKTLSQKSHEEILVVLAILAPVIAPRDPFAIDGPRLTAPNAEYFMGTDNLGRDMFSGVLAGARISLLIGIIAAGISAIIGIIVGSISGYYGGWIDVLLSRMTEVFLITPSFFLIIVVVATLGSNFLYIMIVIGLTTWATNARLMRVRALALRERTFVQAALALGEPRFRILVRHVIPNGLAPVIANSTLLVANAILIEAGLSFLGLGDPNVTSWGQMVFIGQRYLRNAPWISLFPGIAIVVTVMSFYLLGDGISAVLNPRRQILDE